MFSMINLPYVTFEMPAAIPTKILPMMREATLEPMQTAPPTMPNSCPIKTALRRPILRRLPPRKLPIIAPMIPAVEIKELYIRVYSFVH